ncbi:hypothetical protein [Methanochimaera problematica]|uniref:hypothetical protein n=1 Tax=Methanochimaera problematica TaxID=2609417 RepID=UPI002938FD9D|nr:hypothetical protein [Methanoplanus sp. FWC-SCC4]
MSKKQLHCPNCDSDDIYPVLGFYTGNIYKCKNCGYQGAFVIEHSSDADSEFKKAALMNKAPSKIRLNINFWLKAFVVIFILFLIISLIIIYI